MNFRKAKSKGRKDRSIHRGDTEFTEKDGIDLGKDEYICWVSSPNAPCEAPIGGAGPTEWSQTKYAFIGFFMGILYGILGKLFSVFSVGLR